MNVARSKGTGSIFQRTDGRWVGKIEAGWTAKGTRRRIEVTAKTQAEVRRKLRDKQAQILKDGLPAAGASDRVTVKTWAEQWIELIEKTHSPSAFNADRAAVNKWIIPTIGHRRLAELTPADVRKVHKAQFDNGGASSSVDRTHGTLRRLLKAAVLEGYQVPQRVREVPGPGLNPSKRDAIPLEDALRVMQVVLSRPDATRWVAAMLQAIRPAEALGLTWGDVDFEANTITIEWQLKPLPYKIARDRNSGFRVPRNYEAKRLVDAYHLVRPKTKRSTGRVIPMIPWFAHALSEWQKIAPDNKWGLIWPTADGRPQNDKKDRAAWYAIAREAGVTMAEGRDPLLYENRHTTTTMLEAAGVDVTTIEAIVGHVKLVKNYRHTDLARAAAALQKLGTQLQLEPPRNS